MRVAPQHLEAPARYTPATLPVDAPGEDTPVFIPGSREAECLLQNLQSESESHLDLQWGGKHLVSVCGTFPWWTAGGLDAAEPLSPDTQARRHLGSLLRVTLGCTCLVCLVFVVLGFVKWVRASRLRLPPYNVFLRIFRTSNGMERTTGRRLMVLICRNCVN